MTTSWIVSILLAAMFQASTQDGTTYRGELRRWDADTLELQTDQGLKQIPIQQLTRVEHADLEATASPSPTAAELPITVELRDESLIRASGIEFQDDSVSLKRGGRREWSVPLLVVRRVRLQPPSPSLEKPWAELNTRPFASDALIIRRDAGRLDFLEGVIKSMNATHVEFVYNGGALQVARTKLEGMVLASTAAIEPLSVRSVITTTSSDRLRCATTMLQENTLLLGLACGSNLILPLNEVKDVTLSQGDVVYLSDLKPDGLDVVPFVAGKEPDSGLIALLYGPQRNANPRGELLSLKFPQSRRLEVYAKALSLHSYSKVVFRLDATYRELRGIVGFDPSVESKSEVELTIRSGEVDLWKETIRSGDEPRDIRLKMNESKRLEFVVDYGADGDFGDRLNLCDLRLIK